MSTPRIQTHVARSAKETSHKNTLRLPRARVVIVTDIVHDEEDHTFVLSADDGTYERSLQTRHEQADAHGFYQLIFDEVPTKRTYTLRVTCESDGEQVVFEKVLYEDLSNLTDALKEEQVEPFSVLQTH